MIQVWRCTFAPEPRKTALIFLQLTLWTDLVDLPASELFVPLPGSTGYITYASATTPVALRHDIE